ncbi:MAG TPA: NRDE family protein [Bacillales bacterium]|nr:NRDE family protein [Bacillales bacterium]
MCLITFAYEAHPRYRLVMAANRDEFYKRPTEQAHFWKDHPDVLAGRDLEKMGTWMGVTKNGRFAAITNYRDPSAENKNAKSRGALVGDYLCGAEPPSDYMKRVQKFGDQYNGFNLIIGDRRGIYYFSNRGNGIQHLGSGLYGLSNALLDTPWPKVEKSKERLAGCLEQEEVNPDCLFDLLADTDQAGDSALPDTGVSLEFERMLSPAFIESRDYGTRASTLLLIDHDGGVFFKERSFYPERQDSSFKFQIST